MAHSSFPAPEKIKAVKAAPDVNKYLDAGLGVVVLKRGKARLFREDKNPMVFGGAVERCIAPSGRSLQLCDAVVVCDGSLACIGYGFYNETSMFRVRMLKHVDGVTDGDGENLGWRYEEDILKRLSQAVKLREMLGLPNGDTNVYRLVNGEGDRLSGLVVDVFDDTVVVSSSAMWCERYKDEILRGLSKVMPDCGDVVWRRNMDRLKQDGFVQTAVQGEAEQAGSEAEKSDGECDGAVEESGDVVVKELGVKYGISRFALTKGQKTGHYADQRENRHFVRQLISQRATETRVLDLFCYTGGFALNAALGSKGTKVTCVDSSGRAIEMGRRNAELNGVEDQIEFVQADVGKYLRGAGAEEKGRYDIVMVDPPKFAPNMKWVSRATHKYRSLNRAAMDMVKHGGVMITCTCSGAMTRDRALFVGVMRQAGREAGRDVVLLKTFGAAADHGVATEMPESEYLTMCVFAVW